MNDDTKKAETKCEKCHGLGWVRGVDLDNADSDTVQDTMTKYTCDACKPSAPEPAKAGTKEADEDEDFVEWIEPFNKANDVVYMRVSARVAIATQKQIAADRGKPYLDDRRALEDFIHVHWAKVFPAAQPPPRDVQGIAGEAELKEVHDYFTRICDTFEIVQHLHSVAPSFRQQLARLESALLSAWKERDELRAAMSDAHKALLNPIHSNTAICIGDARMILAAALAAKDAAK